MELAPDDQELNYGEAATSDAAAAAAASEQLRHVNSVFNERHAITESQVNMQQ